MTIPIPWIISALTFFGGIIVWAAKLAFERSLDARDKKMEHEERQKEAEMEKKAADQETRDRMILRGLRTLTESQYEVIYAMKNGHHNGGLDDCMDNITSYKHDVDQWFEDLAVRR